jgi:hypothetical protein
MIRAKEIRHIQGKILEVSSSYAASVKTYNIVTTFMSDDCKAYQIGNGICIWLDNEGRLGEIECIYPIISDVNSSVESTAEITKIEGIPLIEIVSLDSNGYVVHQTEQFVIWFSENQQVSHEVRQGNIRYLLSKEQIVGIVANGFEIR